MKLLNRPGIVLFIALFLTFGVATACDVPVFRFALERWQPDTYKVMITGQYSEPEKDQLRQPLELINVEVEFLEGEQPRVDLFTPGEHPKRIFSHDAPQQAVAQIADSDIRKAVVDKILSGVSGVFVIVNSGNEAQDNQALIEVNHAIQNAEKQLTILSGVVHADSEEKDLRDPDNNLRSTLDLKIDFDVIVMDRSNDVVITQMLLSVEDDLSDIESVMVFPLFGRGRVLPPFIGKGISRDNLMTPLREITAACSCTIKNQNPGSDIILQADWDARLKGNEVIIDKTLPELMGMGDLHQSKSTPEQTPPVTAEKKPLRSEQPNLPLRWVIVGITGFIILGTFIIRAKGRQSN
jgi:hypothetical protein